MEDSGLVSGRALCVDFHSSLDSFLLVSVLGRFLDENICARQKLSVRKQNPVKRNQNLGGRN